MNFQTPGRIFQEISFAFLLRFKTSQQIFYHRSLHLTRGNNPQTPELWADVANTVPPSHASPHSTGQRELAVEGVLTLDTPNPWLTRRRGAKLGVAVAEWLRCCATNRKVAGSIPDNVGIFYWHKILPVALWPWVPTQPPTEMSTRSISWWGKSGLCVRLTTYHHLVPLLRNLGAVTSWNPLGSSGL